MMTPEEAISKGIIEKGGSPTARLIAMRKMPTQAPLVPGVWYSNYSRVRAEALARHIPLIGVWTNGDRCSFCRRFAENLLNPVMADWMKSSGVLFWLGTAADSLPADAVNGDGYMWASSKGKLNIFPFVGTMKPDGSTVYGKGADFDGNKRGADGAATLVRSFSDFTAKCGAFPKGQQHVANANTANPGTAAVNGQQHVANANTANPGTAAVNDAPPAPVRRLAIRLNQTWDAAHISRFKDAMARNGGHCLCCAVKDSTTLCMCKAFMESSKPGLCGCGVFEKYYA